MVLQTFKIRISIIKQKGRRVIKYVVGSLREELKFMFGIPANVMLEPTNWKRRRLSHFED